MDGSRTSHSANIDEAVCLFGTSFPNVQNQNGIRLKDRELYLLQFSYASCPQTHEFSVSVNFTDVSWEGHHVTRVCNQSSYGLVPEIRLQTRRIHSGLLRQILPLRLERMPTRIFVAFETIDI